MRKLYKAVVCEDGFSVSIQAGRYNYCEPKLDSCVEGYTSVELGFPSRPCPFIMDYAETPENLTGSVYGYVPAHIVRRMLLAHGGIVEGECPPLAR
jgi:hypothetical protein